VRLFTEVTPELIREIAPDIVFAAIGPQREPSKIPGADRDHVFDGDGLRELLTGDGDTGAEKQLSIAGRLAVRIGRFTGVTSDPSKLRRASKIYMPVGKRVAIIGGGLVGAELAEFMAERGREVSVFEEGPVLAKEMSHPRRWRVLHDLRDAGVVLHAETEVTAIGADTLEFRSLGSETNVQSLPVDTVIIATGLVANPEGVEALRSAGVPLVVIGDANGTVYLDGAIEQGFMAAIDLG
jgi:NADPH-dependent 2,4-dienoyl-CoA reductase/sulfur reductase-like enzyme